MRLVLLLGLALCAAPARAMTIPIHSFELPNGLRVVLSPDRTVPVVTLAAVFDVGGRQEVRGRSGFAHLFEHLMFEGSAHVPKGRFDKLLEGFGADNNASTHEDFTFYYEVMPSNVLPLAAWLDADRLSALDVSETNMRNQVSVVKEEKRMRVDNEAYAPLLAVEIASRTFSNYANSHPLIGTFEDLDAARFALELLHPRLAVVVLAHLSHECNRPELALRVVEGELRSAGWKGHMEAAAQDRPTGWLDVEELRAREGPGQLTLL